MFCHGNFARAWISHLLHVPVHLMWAGFDITHTGVTLIDLKNVPTGYTVPHCLLFSDVSHLYGTGNDVYYNNGLKI